MADPLIYGTVDNILLHSGVKYEDFDFEDDVSGDDALTADEKLQAAIVGLMVQAKSIIDNDRRRDYYADVDSDFLAEIPPGIASISERMVANVLAIAVIRRESTKQRVDLSVRIPDNMFLTDFLRQELQRFPLRATFRLSRVRSTHENTVVDFLAETEDP